MLRVLSSGADWDIVDDDGFIYKRKKVQIGAGSDTNGEVSTMPQSFEQYRNSESPAFEEARNKRKEMLLMMRNIYSAELQQWKELYSEHIQEAEYVLPENIEPTSSAVADCHANSLGDPYQEAHIELSRQVEELEQLVKECTDMCDQAENVVRVLDENIQKQEEQLFRPLFTSPHQLFADLTIPD